MLRLIQLGGHRFKHFFATSQNPFDFLLPFSCRAFEVSDRLAASADQHLIFPFHSIGNPFSCLLTRPRRKESGEPGSDSKARE